MPRTENDHFRDVFAYAHAASERLNILYGRGLRGAIDFHRERDGVWRLPKRGPPQGATVSGFELATGKDQAVVREFSR